MDINNINIPQDFELVFKGKRSPNGETYDKKDSVFQFKARNKEIEILKLNLGKIDKENTSKSDRILLYKKIEKDHVNLLLHDDPNTQIISRSYNEKGFYVHSGYNFEKSGKLLYRIKNLFLNYNEKDYVIRLKYEARNIPDSISENEIKFIYEQFITTRSSKSD